MADWSHEYRRHGWWREETFLDDLRRHARERPAATALIGHRADGALDLVSYADLLADTDRYAARLLDIGVEPGDVIAVQLPDWYELVPLALACARVGARFCPLMPIYRQYELAHILALTEAKVCVTMAEWDGDRLAEIVAGLDLPHLEHVLVAGEPRPAETASLDDFLEEHSDTTPTSEVELAPDDPYLILFTSGTTGEPKGVLHSQNTLYAAARGFTDAMGLDDGLVMEVAHVNTHMSGFAMGLMVPLLLGGTAVFQERWDGGVALDLAQEHGLTLFYGAAPFLTDVLDGQRERPRDLRSLRWVVTGSAQVPPHIVDEVQDVFGLPTYSLWGMTENGPVTVTRPDDPPDWGAHSDGRPIEGMELRVDSLKGRDDGAGRLWVRGAAQCLGYFRRDELYEAELDADGWFDTGDLARDDGRGGIRIAGRAKDIIMYKSLNVPVTEVEAVLGRHPKVREVAVVGITHPEVLEEVCAVVLTTGEPLTLEELHEHMRASGMNDWFWPRRLEIVERMPKTVTGKIRKVELRQRYGGG
ncbi:AMP-binding protein [Spirillospora sp. NPDC048911]|uniref:AMP-binding protein n=1 Tax=Spirillospora sp. NPDC048911 TaxID=3364527 RepID=UPI00371F9485